jgi:tetratricopeptide (TPR) repeat protein
MRAFLGIVVVTTAAATMTAAQASRTRPMQMLDGWIAAVDQHRAGETDEALHQLSAWTHDDLGLMQAWIEMLALAPNDSRERAIRRRQISGADRTAIAQRIKDLQARGDFDLFRKRAAILHTDTAILASVAVVVEPPAAKPRARNELANGVNVLSFDGRVEQYELANPHWEYAISLLDALPTQPRRDPVVAEWYRAIGAYFANERRYADALRHFEQARRVVPNAPQVLFGDACLQETLGAPRIQDYVRVTTLPNGLTIRGIESPQSHLRRAESLLKRALAAEPQFVEANLRLGRVLSQLMRHEEALPYLHSAIRDSRDRTINYYAQLFIGDAMLSLSRPAAAQEAYERALAIHPNAQAARLGLGVALRTLGNRQGALDAIMPALTQNDDAVDPWWNYYFGDAANVDRLLHELRAPYRSPRQ